MKKFIFGLLMMAVVAALGVYLFTRLPDSIEESTAESMPEISLVQSAPESRQESDVSEESSDDESLIYESAVETEVPSEVASSEDESVAVSEVPVVSVPEESEAPESEATVTKSFRYVRAVLRNANLSGDLIAVDPAADVTVRLAGTEKALEGISASDITVVLDLTGIKTKGTYDIKATVTSTLPEGVTVSSISPKYVPVLISDTTPFASEAESTVSEDESTVSETESRDESRDESQEESEPDPVVSAPFMSNGFIVWGNRLMNPVSGTAKSGELTAATADRFAENVGENVKVYVLAIPSQSGIYAPDKYPKSIENTRNMFNGVRDNVEKAIYVDALSNLMSHKDEELYLHTDYHWAALGAYYAAQSLAAKAGLPFADLSTFTVESFDGYIGAMYSHIDDKDKPAIDANPETFVYYVPTQEYICDYYSRDRFKLAMENKTLFSSSNSYPKFIYGDSYTTHIRTGIENGRKLLVIKESFGNALAPFLIGSYEEVYIADIRYFSLNVADFVAEQGITDVCLALSTGSVGSSTMRGYLDRMFD